MTPEFSSSGVSQATADELVKYYQAAADRLAGIILKPGSSTAATTRAQQLSLQIDLLMRQLKARAAEWVGSAVPAAMADGIARGTQQAIAVNVDVDHVTVKGSFDLIDSGALQLLARDTAGDLYKAADKMGTRAVSVLRQTSQYGLSEGDINRILAGGVIDGVPGHTIGQLRDALTAVHGTTVPITGKDGVTREYEVGNYARTVARTKTRQATTDARHNRLSSLGLDLVRIVGRTSIYFCTAYLGQVFSISGTDGKYPALSSLPSGGPPFHPNCSKSTAPYVEALASTEEIDDAEGDDDQAKLLNVDPSEAQRRWNAIRGMKTGGN